MNDIIVKTIAYPVLPRAYNLFDISPINGPDRTIGVSRALANHFSDCAISLAQIHRLFATIANIESCLEAHPRWVELKDMHFCKLTSSYRHNDINGCQVEIYGIYDTDPVITRFAGIDVGRTVARAYSELKIFSIPLLAPRLRLNLTAPPAFLDTAGANRLYGFIGDFDIDTVEHCL